MIALFFRRLLGALAVVVAVALVAFVLFQHVGDPVSQMLGQDATETDRQRVRADLGLDRPVLIQFARFMSHAARGDFGISLQQGRPVAGLLKERMPATLELSFCAAVLAVAVGVLWGIYTALVPGGLAAYAVLTVSLVGISLPTFLIGILLIFVFSVQLGWLPSYGRGETIAIGWWSSGLLTLDGIKHLVLPTITLALFQLTLVMRLVRAEMLEVLRTDYIKFAKARGLTDRSLNFKHALRNTLIPVVTIIGLQFGSIIAFGVVTETVFQWPGMGYLFIQAVNFADVPVMAAYLCFVALVFVLISVCVDILYVRLDPRLRIQTKAN